MSATAQAVGTNSSPLAALSNRDFRQLVSSNIFTQLGQWTQQVGRGWLIYSLSHSAFQLGLVAFCSGIAMFVSAPIGGVLSDRFDRRKVVGATQFVLALVGVTLAVLVTTHAIRFWHLYLTAFVMGVAVSINGPTRNAMVHDIVGDKNLRSAISLNSMSMNSMRILGPAVGAAMIGFAGVTGTFWLQAGACVLAMFQMLRINAPNSAPPNRPKIRRPPKHEGWHRLHQARPTP